MSFNPFQWRKLRLTWQHVPTSPNSSSANTTQPIVAQWANATTVAQFTQQPMRCEILDTGAFTTAMTISLHGLSLADMQQLTTRSYWSPNSMALSEWITLEAQQSVTNAWVTVGAGWLRNAFPDFNTMPNVPLVLSIDPSAGPRVQVGAPYSINGPTALETVLENLLTSFGYVAGTGGLVSFQAQNRTVNTCHLQGNLQDQIQQLARMFNLQMIWEDGPSPILYVSERNTGIRRVDTGGFTTSSSEQPINVSVQTGLIGWPSYSTQGAALRSVFDPRLRVGEVLSITTDAPKFDGSWFVTAASHELEYLLPGSRWETTVQLSIGGTASP